MASRLVGDMFGSTLDDPLSDRYKKLGCSVSALEKDSDDYKMIVKYLDTTYEPVRVGDIVRLHILTSLMQSVLINTMLSILQCLNC
jgi:hypothetical protein